MKLGFIGLGTLGRAIAQRLISQGNELVVWNRSANKAEGLGARLAASPAEVTAESSIIFLCLFDSPAVEAVLTGPSGVLSTDCRGKIICDITTNHFQEVAKFHSLVADHGGTYLETPVLGSVVPALSGNLVALVSGEEKAYATVRPTIEQMSNKIFYLPEIAAATKMKLINNVLLGSFMTAIAEATVLAEKSGIPKEAALDILGAGAGNSAVLSAKREALLKEDFSVKFAAATIHKDLTYLHDLAVHLGISDAMASTARAAFAAAIEKGLGPQDLSVVYKSLK
jgi:3-hydroxyisobutyrate dehydrogenase